MWLSPAGLIKPGGWILINAPAQPESLTPYFGFRLAYIDATGIAIQNQLGTRTYPIVNTTIIGAFARLLETPPMEMIADAIKESIQTKPEQHIQASKDAYESVQNVGMVD